MANRINNRRYNKLLSYRNNYYSDGGFYIPDNLLSVGNLDSLENNNLSYDNYKLPSLDIINNSDVISKVIPNLEFDNNNSFLSKVKGLFNKGSLNGAATAVGGMVEGAIGDGMSSGIGNAIGGLGNIASAIPGPWGAVAGAGLKVIGGLTNRAFGSKMNEGNIAGVNSDINRLNNFQSNASSFDTLANTWGTTKLGNNFSNSYIGKDGWFSSKAKNKAKQLRNKLRIANNFTLNSLQNNADNITNDTMNNLEANYAALGGFLNQYANGGSIHINPENRGKFNATKKRTGKTTEELTHSKNPLTRKRAIFAQNAAKWHHAFGGELNTNGGDFSTGLIFIDEGGTHESNPYEGVPMGVAPDGKPNLVEEGEAIYNDYVFSNRLTVPKSVRSKYKLKGTKDLTFADAVKQISKSTTERPNDPISQETLHEIMSDLAQTQEGVREEAHKGNRFDTGGFTPIKRANRYFLRGTDAKGNPIVTPMKTTPWEGLNEKGQSFAEAFPTYSFKGKQERPVEGNTIYTDYYYDEKKPAESTPSTEGDTPPLDLGRSDESLRYAPAVGLGMAALSDALGITNKPDYTEAAQIEAATRGGSYMPVSWNPIGNKLTYRPFDRDYYTNKLNAEASATRRALANQSGGNSGRAIAGILAADYNTQDKLGDLFRKSEEYNLEQRQKVEDFNRATNQLNAQGMLQADMANQQAAANARDYNLRGVLASAEMRQKARMAAEAARSANLSGFLQSLGDIGYENKAMNMIRRLAEAGYVPLSEPMQNIYATPSARRKLTSNRKKK